MVSEAATDSSGIGQYTEHLSSEISELLDISTIDVEENSKSPIPYLIALFKIWKQSKQQGVSNIHIQFDYITFGYNSMYAIPFIMFIYFLKAVNDTKIIITLHEIISPSQIIGHGKWVKSVYISLVNKMVRVTSDKMVFLSKQAQERFPETLERCEYEILPHGVVEAGDIDMEQTQAKKEFGYDPSTPLIVQPGYVSPRKGSKSFVKMAKSLPNYQFLIAGGAARESNEQYFQEIQKGAPENLEVTGKLPEDLFKISFLAADLVVLPYQETNQNGVVNLVNQSGVLNHCAAFAVPVLTSDCNRFEYIRDKYKCINIYDQENIDDATESIIHIIEDESIQQALSSNMQAYYEQNTMTSVAKEHSSLYSSL